MINQINYMAVLNYLLIYSAGDCCMDTKTLRACKKRKSVISTDFLDLCKLNADFEFAAIDRRLSRIL